jgi:hypothetical protein
VASIASFAPTFIGSAAQCEQLQATYTRGPSQDSRSSAAGDDHLPRVVIELAEYNATLCSKSSSEIKVNLYMQIGWTH